jgi:hypothetical protein
MYNSRMTASLRRRSGPAALCIAVVLVAAGCRSREVEKDLRITDIKTGWYDAGIVDGQNKLVPSISFRLQNISGEAISRVKMNAVFHTVDAPQDAWGDYLIQAIGSSGLDAGATGGRLVMRSPRGYTGSEPRLVMLKNSQFIDATVSVFGRHGSRNWIKLGDFRIDRQLLTE